MPHFNNTVKVSIFGATLGLVLIGALAMFFRRRKNRKAKLYKDLYIEASTATDGSLERSKYTTAENIQSYVARRRLNSKYGSSNGDISHMSSSPSPANNRSRSVSTLSIHSEANSTSTITANAASADPYVPPGQLLDLGLDLVLKARCRWELALQEIEEMDVVDEECIELRGQLEQLLDLASRMQTGCKTDFLNQVCTKAALDAALDEMDREFEQRRRNLRYSFDESSSDMDSFVSAMADLSDLDDQKETFQHLALYEAALLELTHGSVPCRVLRTRMVNCSSDTEFLSKLHCIRLAFETIFEKKENREWFIEMGRNFISSLLINADKDAEDFLTSYDEMISYVKEVNNWKDIEEELKSRGVKVMSFYDIVIDFLLFDGFDDLENPPTSVAAVLQNRWLTSGFKEMALSTAVWSVLKAKRTVLRFPRGFISHFYTISESTTPVLAYGFLGPEGALKDMCHFFKSHILQYIHDIFSFDKVRYTTVDQLAEDILRVSKESSILAQERMGAFAVS